MCCRLIEVELRIGKFRTLLRNRGIDTPNFRFAGETCALLFRCSRREALLCDIQVTGSSVECRPSDNILCEQLGLTIIVILRQPELRIYSKITMTTKMSRPRAK